MEKKKMTVKERMNAVLEVLGVSSVEFEKSCGLGAGFVSRINDKVRKSSMKRIANVYPSLNMEWVTHEKGEMFSGGNSGNDPLETIHDRLLYFTKRMNLSQSEFERKANLGVGLMGKSSSPRRASLNKIYAAFPMLNPMWLESGTGEMLRKPTEIKMPTSTVTERLRAIVKFLGSTQRVFEENMELPKGYLLGQHENITISTVDRIVAKYPFISAQWIMHGMGEMLSLGGTSVTAGFAPLVEKANYKSYVSHIDDIIFVSSLPTFPYRPDKTLGNIIAFEVTGDAMFDGSAESIPDGAVVLGNEVERLEDLTDGRDYIIVHKDGILIKRIVSHGGAMLVRSLNKFYGDVELEEKDILRVYSVVSVTLNKR